MRVTVEDLGEDLVQCGEAGSDTSVFLPRVWVPADVAEGDELEVEVRRA